MNREVRSLNKEVIKTLSAELGVPEEKVPNVISALKEALAEDVKAEAMRGVGRRALMAAGLGGLLGLAVASPASAKMTITDDYIDLNGEKFYPSSVAPYSAIVYIDGTKVKAEDWRGREIAREEAGVGDAEVIQRAVTEIGEGKIFIARGTYKLTQKISCPAGIFFESEGAELDITGLNDVAFEFGSKDSTSDYYKYTGFKNIVFRGDQNNTNSTVAIFYRIPHGVYIYNVKINGGYNGIILDGECYDALLDHLFIYHVVNDQIVARKGSSNDSPNGVKVVNSDIGYGTSSRAILIDGKYGYVISNTYIETADGICIEVNGRATIKGCFLSGSKNIVHNGGRLNIIGNQFTRGVAIEATGSDLLEVIVGNRFSYWYVSDLPDYLIYSSHVLHATITGNTFFAKTDLNPDSKLINAMLVYGEISGNTFIGKENYGTFIYLYNYTNYTTIVGNTFNRADIGIKSHSTNVNRVIVTNNTFYNLNTGIDFTYTGDNNIIIGNLFDNVSTPILVDFTKVLVRNNRGYTTESSGIATLSGDGSTTDFLIGDHGLAVTDPTKIVVKVTPIGSDAIAASPCVGYVDPNDNTKIRVKFASAPASGTDNVKIVWEAQMV